MRYIEAPVEYEGGGAALFLAGGISDAENWQRCFLRLLPQGEYTVLNPRRTEFPVGDTSAEAQQIEWEVRHLRRATMAAFWFPPQTLCPIALFELGCAVRARSRLLLGADANYARRFDVEVHLRLERPNVVIANTLQSLATQVANHCELKEALR